MPLQVVAEHAQRLRGALHLEQRLARRCAAAAHRIGHVAVERGQRALRRIERRLQAHQGLLHLGQRALRLGRELLDGVARVGQGVAQLRGRGGGALQRLLQVAADLVELDLAEPADDGSRAAAAGR